MIRINLIVVFPLTLQVYFNFQVKSLHFFFLKFAIILRLIEIAVLIPQEAFTTYMGNIHYSIIEQPFYSD